MLFVSRAVADALDRGITIRWARLIPVGTDSLRSVFVLSRCPARLADVYKGRASTVFSPSFLIHLSASMPGFEEQAWYQSAQLAPTARAPLACIRRSLNASRPYRVRL